MGAKTPIGTVYWEERPAKQRDVVSLCRRCQKWLAEGRPRTLDEVTIVSPTGIGHIQEWDGGDRTQCGIIATGTDWWWRL